MSYNAKEHEDMDTRATVPALPEVKKTNLDFLEEIVTKDVVGLRKAQISYGDSWKRRGGVGAFMMMARKWDRIEEALRPGEGAAQGAARFVRGTSVPCGPYDIFRAAELDTRSEGIIDDIRDLRRYLLLVESEIIARGTVHGTHRDNQ